MSKIGKKPIVIPEGVKVEMKDNFIILDGKQGTLTLPILNYVDIENKGNALNLSLKSNNRQARANWGTMASLIRNAIQGVCQGYTKNLRIEGVGYKANMEGDILVLNVGFSHTVKFKTPDGIKISVEKNIIRVEGIDKNLVGQTAAGIRKIKKPEPYKGKGIRYENEVVRRKVGKKVAGAGNE